MEIERFNKLVEEEYYVRFYYQDHKYFTEVYVDNGVFKYALSDGEDFFKAFNSVEELDECIVIDTMLKDIIEAKSDDEIFLTM